MDYEPNEWPAIITAIERQGGALLPDKCEGTLIPYTTPNATRTNRVPTCQCLNNSMFVATYDPSDDAKERAEMTNRGAGFVRACAVCDSAGLWPRYEDFADALEA